MEGSYSFRFFFSEMQLMLSALIYQELLTFFKLYSLLFTNILFLTFFFYTLIFFILKIEFDVDDKAKIESQLKEHVSKHSTKLVLSLQSSDSQSEECVVSCNSQILAGKISSLLDSTGFSSKFDQTESNSLLLKGSPNIVDVKVATPLLQCADSRRELCQSFVSTLSDPSLTEFVRRKPEIRVPIPNDLNLLADVMLNSMQLPKVQVVKL